MPVTTIHCTPIACDPFMDALLDAASAASSPRLARQPTLPLGVFIEQLGRAASHASNASDSVPTKQHKQQHKQQHSQHSQQTPVFKPLIDVWDSPQAIRVVADLPGVSKDGIRADIDRHGICNTSSQDTTSNTDQPQPQPQSPQSHQHDQQTNTQFTLQFHERRLGRFRRVVQLPTDIDTAGIQAKFDHGVLDILIPKLPVAAKTSISIA
ncbi:HSP20-like chaperone [Entophlyctis helioformis]|nr:HSP20-like chaperone [Entophlyctis helioformis]